MARRVYFAFDYQDVFEVNQIRRSSQFENVSVRGFTDASQWEKLKNQNDSAVYRAIDSALVNTSVTVVCIGARTASRKFVKYEVHASKERDNGLLGVYLPNGGAYPAPTEMIGASVYHWDSSRFSDWVEMAAQLAGR